MDTQPDPLTPLKVLIAEQSMDVTVNWDDCGAVTLNRKGSPTNIVIDLFWHKTGFAPTRYQCGEMPNGALLHYWVSWVATGTGQHNSQRFRICHDIEQVANELTAWADPARPVPSEVVIPPVAPPVRQPWPNLPPMPQPDVSCVLDLSSQDLLNQDIARIDWPRLITHWPLAADGTPMLKARLLLAAYGPPTSRRQPCLMVRSCDTKRDLLSAQAGNPGGFTITVSDEFVDNQSDNWTARPWLWTTVPVPDEPPLADQCRALLMEGQFSQACQVAGVELGDLLRRASNGLTLIGSSVTHYVDFDPEWMPILHATLARLAPWLLADGLARLEARLAASNKKPPKRGIWSRRLVDFPGQRQSRKLGLHASLTTDGHPLLDIAASASNARLPWSDWTESI